VGGYPSNGCYSGHGHSQELEARKEAAAVAANVAGRKGGSGIWRGSDMPAYASVRTS
jgi:hypothetical protein